MQDRFYAITGLDLGMRADLSLPILCKPAQVAALLMQDQAHVDGLYQERADFYAAHPQDYEQMAWKRDQIKECLKPYAHVKDLTFDIATLYEVEFWIKDTRLTFISYIDQFYGIEALCRTLDELGGTFTKDIDIEKQRRTWGKLKPWNEYDSFTRPSK